MVAMACVWHIDCQVLLIDNALEAKRDPRRMPAFVTLKTDR